MVYQDIFFKKALFENNGGIFMYMNMKSCVNIESQTLIDRMLNSHISHCPSCSPSDKPSEFSKVDKNPDPLCIVSQPSIVSERIDDIPLLMSILLKLNLPKIVDLYYTPHSNHEGLSYGWLLTIWLVYILSQSDHCMNHVQNWAASRCSVLIKVSGQMLTEQDFTDDRLARVLKMLSNDTLWLQIEQHISQHTIRAYDLDLKKIRLDATTASVNHNPDKSNLFKIGRTKQNLFESQFKIMLASLDSHGLPIAVDVVSGEKADDPLYVPIYKRVNETLGKIGMLYIGDSKMSAIETRATIHKDGNYYLMPLPMTKENLVTLDILLSELETGEHTLSNIFLPEDIDKNEDKDPDPDLAIAKGFETFVQRTATLDKKITWEERICCVQSFRYAASQSKGLDSRIAKAEKKLKNLTPPPGPGIKPYKDEAELKSAADNIVKRYKVNDLIEYTLERQESHRNIRAYGGKPARTETRVRYQIHIEKNIDAIEQHRKRLGWRLYPTNAPCADLCLNEVVLTYRDQYIVERNFARLKGRRLGITPLYVQRDDHACGLIRLLTLALRAMCLTEFSVHKKLLEEQDVLQGIYPGNPARKTETPSIDLMLRAFNGLDLFITKFPNGQRFEQISHLNDVQKKILYLLDLPESIYNHIPGKTQYGLKVGVAGPEKYSVSKSEQFRTGGKSR